MKNSIRYVGQAKIGMTFLLMAVISTSAIANSGYRLEVTYTNGSIISGPLSFGLSSLPTSVTATFILGSGEVVSEPGEFEEVHFDEADALFGTRITFGDAIWSHSDLADFSLVYSISTGGSGGEDRLTGLSYEFFPVNTQIVDGGIVLNFPLSITGADKASGQVFEYSYTESTQTLTAISEPRSVDIDIKPGSDSNCFNINGNGVVPVAVLGDANFDVSQIDPDSLVFGGLAVRVRGNKGALCSIDYSNDDVYFDLACHFEDDATNWDGGDTQATLTGSLFDGSFFEGEDSICIVP